MNSESKPWKIDKITNKARRNINALSPKFHEKVIKRFECLQKKPFDNVVKAEGKEIEKVCLKVNPERSEEHIRISAEFRP